MEGMREGDGLNFNKYIPGLFGYKGQKGLEEWAIKNYPKQGEGMLLQCQRVIAKTLTTGMNTGRRHNQENNKQWTRDIDVTKEICSVFLRAPCETSIWKQRQLNNLIKVLES